MFPGGGIDAHEVIDIQASARRELLEETGLVPEEELLYLGSVARDRFPARANNRKENKYMRVEIKLVVKDIPFNVSLATTSGIVGAEKAFTIKGGLPPYSFDYDKTKVEILKVKPGSTKPDGNYYIFPLVAGKVSITVKDAHTQSKKIDLTVQALDTTVVPGEELRFSNQPGFYLSQISATNGTILPIRKTPNTRFVDTSNVTQNTDLTVYKYSDVERKSLKYTYNIITREVATGPSGYTLCANDNGTCIAKDNIQVAYGTKGSYKYKDLAKGQSLSCSIATFGNPVNGVRACRTKVINLGDLKGPAGYTECAIHGGTCTIPSKAKVAYGVDGTYDYKTTEKAIACTNTVFKDVAPGELKGCRYEVIVEKVVEEEVAVIEEKNDVERSIDKDNLTVIHIPGLGFSIVSLDTKTTPKQVGIEYKDGLRDVLDISGNEYISIVEKDKGEFRPYYVDQNNIRYVGNYDQYSETSIASDGVGIASAPNSYRCEYKGKYYVKPYNAKCIEDGTGAWECNQGYVDLDKAEYGNTNSCILEGYVTHNKVKGFMKSTTRDYVIKAIKKANKTFDELQEIRAAINGGFDGHILETLNLLLDHLMDQDHNQENTNEQKSDGEADSNQPSITNPYTGFKQLWKNTRFSGEYEVTVYEPNTGTDVNKNNLDTLLDREINVNKKYVDTSYLLEDRVTFCKITDLTKAIYCTSYRSNNYAEGVTIQVDEGTRIAAQNKQNKINMIVGLPDSLLNGSNIIVVKALKEEMDADSMSLLVSLVPGIGEVHDISTIILGEDPLIKGKKLEPFERGITFIGLASGLLSGKLARESVDLALKKLKDELAISLEEIYKIANIVIEDEYAFDSVADVLSIGGKLNIDYFLKALKDTAYKTPLGRGCTGRCNPANLKEKLALDVAMSNPLNGHHLKKIIIEDPRRKEDGRVKMTQNINGVEVHYLYNQISKMVDDFKIK